jgi:peptidoglycan/xylan/chitin deacetylase (PgdA/CDA1 family)
MRKGVALAYHGIGTVDDVADPLRLVVSPERLESQIRLLQRRGYRFLSADEVIAEGGLPSRTAALTFDDGFRSWLTLGVPLLRELGVTATFYVTSGWLGGRHPRVDGEAGALLDATDARALADAGMEVGAHSVTHADLRTLGDDDLERELAESRAAISAVTGRACTTMAYPYGFYDDRVRTAARRAGYELAWAWLPGPWDPLAAPRLPAPPRHGARRLRLKLLGIRRPADKH